MIGSLLYQIIVVAFASYLTWFWLLSRYPASALAAFSFLMPLFGMVAGGRLLGERISGALAAAMLFVALDIFLVNRATGGVARRSGRSARRPSASPRHLGLSSMR